MLVDDGSPDNCGNICDGYAQKDGRVIVIHEKHHGVSAARNAGLELVLKENREPISSYRMPKACANRLCLMLRNTILTMMKTQFWRGVDYIEKSFLKA